jgi:hypothetical protein
LVCKYNRKKARANLCSGLLLQGTRAGKHSTVYLNGIKNEITEIKAGSGLKAINEGIFFFTPTVNVTNERIVEL